jgi:hypothetical protein
MDPPEPGRAALRQTDAARPGAADGRRSCPGIIPVALLQMMARIFR